MRYILLVILVLISFGTSAQAPPMSIGGPQGINVKRILAQDWMSVPIMADTPVAPLTGSGWPGRGYVVFVAQNPDSICAGCPPADTSLWEYTGQRWKRVGMDYLTKLVFGGEVTQSNTFSRRFFVGSYGAFINGSYYTKVPFTTLTTSPKVADSTSRIDAIVLTPLGPSIKVGVARQVPLKPSISSYEIELSTIYFPPFDTVPRFIPVATGVTSVFRVPGKDSIFYSIDTTTFAIKDSIGITKNDTAAMLNPYKFTAANGLTKDSTVFRLGGSLNQNTSINLNSRRLSIIGGSDTTRFFSNGRVSIGGSPDSTFKLHVNGRTRISDTLTLSTTPVTSDTTANDLLVINSSNGQVRRYTGAWPVASPTLQQVTTAGKVTTDTIKAAAFRIPTAIGTDVILSDDGQAYRASFKIAGSSSYAWLRGGQLELINGSGFNGTLNNINGTKSNTINLPDSTGVLTQRVSINGTTYNTAANGVVDMNGLWINGSATLDFATTTAQTSSDLTITVTGASEGDVVSLGTPQGVASTNICYTAWVSSTNTVTVRLNNYGTTGVDPGPATFKVKVFK